MRAIALVLALSALALSGCTGPVNPDFTYAEPTQSGVQPGDGGYSVGESYEDIRLSLNATGEAALGIRFTAPPGTLCDLDGAFTGIGYRGTQAIMVVRPIGAPEEGWAYGTLERNPADTIIHIEGIYSEGLPQPDAMPWFGSNGFGRGASINLAGAEWTADVTIAGRDLAPLWPGMELDESVPEIPEGTFSNTTVWNLHGPGKSIGLSVQCDGPVRIDQIRGSREANIVGQEDENAAATLRVDGKGAGISTRVATTFDSDDVYVMSASAYPDGVGVGIVQSPLGATVIPAASAPVVFESGAGSYGVTLLHGGQRAWVAIAGQQAFTSVSALTRGLDDCQEQCAAS